MNDQYSFKKTSTMQAITLFVLIAGVTFGFSFSAKASTEQAALIKSYYSYLLLEQSTQQIEHMAQRYSPSQQHQISNSNKQWLDYSLKKVKKSLKKSAGANSKQAFQSFVSTYTTAEKENDQAYLAELAQTVGMRRVPPSYAAFRDGYTNKKLGPQISYCARYISEVQTWLDVQSKHANAPNLQQWLSKDSSPKKAKKKKRTPVNALVAAEAPLPEFTFEEDEDDMNPMDAFSQMRDERRQRVVEQAQAGMAQVAAEREAAESAYAEKKATAAQAEADAVAAQARKLATAEEDALAQRQNSWSARLKKLVSGTLSGAVGAFTGGIGAEAGVRASNAVFGN